MAEAIRIIDSRHPNFLSNSLDWTKWRTCYAGGEEFRDMYLKQFSRRETTEDYNTRREITPIPTFAKAAVNDIRNAIYQRLRDIVRRGGSLSYQAAVNGLGGGVDRQGSTMNAFIGMKVLTDLLVMGMSGVYVDNAVIPANGTLSDVAGASPYLYPYQREDILNWATTEPGELGNLKSLLLRDTVFEFDQSTQLPITTFQRYRMLWLEDGVVYLQFYDHQGTPVDAHNSPSGPTVLELQTIPFVLLDIGDSLIKDAAEYQIALLNLCSSDVNYAVLANFPFYTEQRDQRAIGAHLKNVASADGTSSAGGQGAADADVKVGVTQGRTYAPNMDRPDFIHPSPEPLLASMKLQDRLEESIRKLVNLAVNTLAVRASAESKSLDNQGLEAGLSYIGLVLENAERQIAKLWAAYEDRIQSRRQIATIKYPDRYSLKTDADRIEEAKKLSDLMFSVPGKLVKQEIAKTIVNTLLGGKVSPETIESIEKEIDKSPTSTSNPEIIKGAFEAGLVGEQSASIALGFESDEYLTAREDHAERVKRIAMAQGGPDATPGARGVMDMEADPQAAKNEKEKSRDTTLQDTTKSRVRGKGK